MRRRTFIKMAIGTAAVSAVGEATIGLRELAKHATIRGLHRKGQIRSEAELNELERLALETQKGIEISNGNPCTTLADYESYGFKLAFGAGFSYKGVLSLLKHNFSYDKYLLVSDIGGSYGTAAEELQAMEGIEAFVIDPNKHLPLEGKGLPRNRFFVKKIENTGLSDNVFHFLTSYNSYQYTDVPDSITEAYRLLKKGGMAILQIQQGVDLDFIETVKSLDIKDNINVAMLLRGEKPNIVPFDNFYAGCRAVHDEYGEAARGMLGAMMQPGFIIGKE